MRSVMFNVRDVYGFSPAFIRIYVEYLSWKQEVRGQLFQMCERCKTRRRMTKKLSIHRFPKVLVIRKFGYFVH